MVSQDDETEEPVICTGCDETPTLFYDPTSDHPLRLRCGCSMASADVTNCLERKALVRDTGKWSNFDYNSKVKENT